MSGDTDEEANLTNFKGKIDIILKRACRSGDKFDPAKANLQYTSETALVRTKDLTKAQKSAFEYLVRKKADQFFVFMMGHIITKVPSNPYSFIIDLLDLCIEFRDNDGEPPLLFEPSHQAIVYRAMDTGDTGTITYEQYCNGMKTMGIKSYNKNPPGREDDKITRKDFLEEADTNLIDELYAMLCPKVESREADIMLKKESSTSSEFTFDSKESIKSVVSEISSNK